MLTSYRCTVWIAVACALLPMLILTSCEGPNHPTYYGDPNSDPFPTGSEPPGLSSVSPDRGFPGDLLVIEGALFRPSMEETMVNVGTAVAEIVEITDSEITIRVPPNEPGTHRVRVAVWGSERWSNELEFTYLSDFALIDYGIANPTGVAVDDDGNLFIGSAHDQAIYRIDGVDSVKTTFANVPVFGPMEFGPGGDLYAVTESGLSRIPASGGSAEEVVTLAGIRDFDWSANGHLFIVIANRIYRLANGNLEELASVTQAQRLRVFDGYVYISELTRARVVRFQITDGGVGVLQPYFNAGTPLAGLDIGEGGNIYSSAYVRDYVIKASPNRMDDSDVEEIPDETDRSNPFRRVSSRLGVVYIHGSVMYLVEDAAGSGTVGRVWRIFIGERNAPRYGRE